MNNTTETGTWIFKDNLFPLIDLLSKTIDKKMSEEEIDDIKHGLIGTNDENNQWSEIYIGKDKINITIAEDPNADIYHIKLSYLTDLSEKVEMILYVIGNYILQKQL